MATRAELEIVHDGSYIESIEDHCRRGGGHVDQDTVAGPGSFDAALRAAGAGPDAVERLRRGEGGAAFLAVRPPGHHALGARAMGFCLFNNVAVTAGLLAAQGERVSWCSTGTRTTATGPRTCSTSAPTFSTCRSTNSPSIREPAR